MSEKSTKKLKMDLSVPKKNSLDTVHTIVSAGLGSVPVAGAAASELFKWLITPSLEKRRDEWMESVSLKLREYEKKIGDLEKLKNNNQFLDALIHATRIALGTSLKEKKEALRNVVIYSALPNPPEVSDQEVFLNFIETMTAWHLKFLKLAENPQSFYLQGQGHFMGSINSLIEIVFPELKAEQDLYRYVWMDLVEKGLIKRIDMGSIGNEVLKKKVTKLGEKFLNFMKEPSE